MTNAHASAALSEYLEVNRSLVEQQRPDMKDFDSDILANALFELKNVAEPDIDDVLQLLTILFQDKFTMWNCPTCDENVYSVDLTECSYLEPHEHAS